MMRCVSSREGDTGNSSMGKRGENKREKMWYSGNMGRRPVMKPIELNQEQVEQFIQAFKEIKRVVLACWERIKKAVKTICGLIYKLPGYKRLAKIKQLQYYQSISSGKSNNWRRNHGLAPLRLRA